MTPDLKAPDVPDTSKAFPGVQCNAVRPQTSDVRAARRSDDGYPTRRSIILGFRCAR